MKIEKPHILVVDDDIRLRQLLKKYLIDNGFRVTSAADTEDARSKMKQILFDLLVLDLMMPGESGLLLARSIREQKDLNNDIPILILTAMGEVDDRIKGLEVGSDDYMVKPFEPKELVLRIKRILARALKQKSAASREVFLGDLTFNLDRNELCNGEVIVSLTSGESQLLGILAKRPDTTFSREDLSGQLSFDGKERAIDVQVNRLRQKLEVNPRFPRYLQTIRGRGYVLRPDMRSK